MGKEKALSELHTSANVRGYDLSAENYNSTALPTFDIYLLGSDNQKTNLFEFKMYGLNFNPQKWIDFRVKINEDGKLAGNYSLVYEFSGSPDPAAKGVLIRRVHLIGNAKPKTNDEIRDDWEKEHTTTTPAPTPAPDGAETKSSSASVIVLAVFVVILSLAPLALGYKYHRTNKKLKEYRVSSVQGSRPYVNPAYNSGTHTPAQRMNSARGSVS